MMSHLSPWAPPLDPSVFPTETTLRFWLLISLITISCLSFSPYGEIQQYLSHNKFRADINREFNECYSRFLSALKEATINVDLQHETPDLKTSSDVLAQCFRVTLEMTIKGTLPGTILVFVAAAITYWFYPARKIRRERLKPLTKKNKPEEVAYIEALCDEIGLIHKPLPLYNPLSRFKDAAAFGRVGRYYVALNPYLILQFRTNQHIFRAVVLHELAHIVNSDINKTFFSRALWKAFVFINLVPLGTFYMYTSYLTKFRDNMEVGISDFIYGFASDLTYLVIILAFLNYITLSSILRAREHYADIRASTWDWTSAQLALRLEATPQAAWWRTMWQVHPNPIQRERILNDPSPLFRLESLEAVLIGVVCALPILTCIEYITPIIEVLMVKLTYSDPEISIFNIEGFIRVLSNSYKIKGLDAIFISTIIGSTPFIFIFGVVIGLCICRESTSNFNQGKKLSSHIRLGLSSGIGLIAGLSLELFVQASPHVVIQETAIPLTFVACLLVASTILYCKWMAGASPAWRKLGLGIGSLYPALQDLVVGSLAFCLWFIVWFTCLIYAGFGYPIIYIILNLIYYIFKPLTILVVIMLAGTRAFSSL